MFWDWLQRIVKTVKHGSQLAATEMITLSGVSEYKKSPIAPLAIVSCGESSS